LGPVLQPTRYDLKKPLLFGQALTMQTIANAAGHQNDVQSIIPTAISGTSAHGRVSILSSGSVMESSGTTDQNQNPLFAFFRFHNG
jgi:hypothetical protein